MLTCAREGRQASDEVVNLRNVVSQFYKLRYPKHLRLMIVAGEASGDAHAATLLRALRKAAPETQFEFFGAA
ncbi:MAG TPA: hypothetical protein VGQ70_05505, partial [Candidatus Udaeobacter sp.]|nr:hypothetical protein [Candidatus Udaeobacter sp.]